MPLSTREQLVEAHRQVFAGLLEATAGLDQDGWATPTGCPGWDVFAQLAHCVGLERVMLGEAMPDVEVPELPHIRNAFGRATERDIVHRRGQTGDLLRAEADEVFTRRMKVLDDLRDDDLESEMDAPIGRMAAKKALRTRIFDLVSHESDIRRALGRPRSGDGPHVEVGVGQVLRAWAALLPRKLDHGPVVGIEVTGHPPATLDLAAGELRPGRDGTAVATLALTPDQLFALGGGRSDAPDLADLRATGDHDAVARLLDVAAITP